MTGRCRPASGKIAAMPTPSYPHPRRWRPSPLILASLGVHGAAAAAVLVRPAVWPWSLTALAVNHALLTGAGLWPRSRLLGPNWTHLPDGTRGIAVTLDDGPDPAITPAVLAILKRYGVRATFFCIGERVQRHPELARALIADGHTVENHSQRHLHRFSLLGPAGLRREIECAQDAIGEVTGEPPLFFRAPAGLRNPFLDPVLQRLGLRLASWTRRGFDTVEASPGRVLGKLTHDLRERDILLLHDGHAARTAGGVPVILEVLPRLLDAVSAAGLRAVTLRGALA